MFGKTAYRIRNWSSYNRSLINRGNVTRFDAELEFIRPVRDQEELVIRSWLETDDDSSAKVRCEMADIDGKIRSIYDDYLHFDDHR